MNVESVQEFCAAFPGASVKETGEPTNVLVYSVGDKPFAWFKTSEPERWRFSFRVTPERFLELTDQAGIKPARYMGRYHWVTVVQVMSVDSAYLQALITWAYKKALSRLSKQRQRQIVSGTADDPSVGNRADQGAVVSARLRN